MTLYVQVKKEMYQGVIYFFLNFNVYNILNVHFRTYTPTEMYLHDLQLERSLAIYVNAHQNSERNSKHHKRIQWKHVYRRKDKHGVAKLTKIINKFSLELRRDFHFCPCNHYMYLQGSFFLWDNKYISKKVDESIFVHTFFSIFSQQLPSFSKIWIQNKVGVKFTLNLNLGKATYKEEPWCKKAARGKMQQTQEANPYWFSYFMQIKYAALLKEGEA